MREVFLSQFVNGLCDKSSEILCCGVDPVQILGFFLARHVRWGKTHSLCLGFLSLELGVVAIATQQ